LFGTAERRQLGSKDGAPPSSTRHDIISIRSPVPAVMARHRNRPPLLRPISKREMVRSARKRRAKPTATKDGLNRLGTAHECFASPLQDVARARQFRARLWWGGSETLSIARERAGGDTQPLSRVGTDTRLTYGRRGCAGVDALAQEPHDAGPSIRRDPRIDLVRGISRLPPILLRLLARDMSATLLPPRLHCHWTSSH